MGWLRISLLWAMLASVAVAAADGKAAADFDLLAELRQQAIPLADEARAEAGLLAAIGDAKLVLLGEGTHGSAEFFEQRARITQRLVADKGFRAVVLEAGWAPTRRLNAYIHGDAAERTAAAALAGFRRFPRWTWRHVEFAGFLDTLKAHNAGTDAADQRVSLYGMDIYEAPEAVADVLAFQRQVAPGLVRETRRDYRCFAPYTRLDSDPSLYGRDVARGWMPSCAQKVARRHAEIDAKQALIPSQRGFEAAMSARAVVGAEAYYRLLYQANGAIASWNQREKFLAESLDILLARHGKLVVWAHNTHQGDARASDMGSNGELSLGQLMRERYGEESVFLLGLTTYAGTVRAASGWATPDRVKRLRPAQAESWPGLLHQVGEPAFLLHWRRNPALAMALDPSRLDRAIGVNYLPQDELRNHYHHARLARLYDAVIHIDTTRAVRVLK